MALVIEDGTIVENANSYCSVSEARAYLLNRGNTTTLLDADVEVFLVKATDYLEMIGNFRGENLCLINHYNGHEPE